MQFGIMISTDCQVVYDVEVDVFGNTSQDQVPKANLGHPALLVRYFSFNLPQRRVKLHIGYATSGSLCRNP